MLSNNYHNIWLKVKEFTKSFISIVTSQLRGAVDSVDVGASVDGTWQCKGSTSLNGGITAVSNDKGKFLDTIILSKSCKGSTRMQTIKDKDPHAYDKWNSAHKCSLNYKRLYLLQWKKWVVKKYSVTKYSLYYNPFYGMVIQKLFQSWKMLTVQKSFLKNMDVLVATKKGLGHVFERKKDVKRFGGKDHLTDAKIDTLQNYFDIAMRQTLGLLTK